MEKTVRTRKSKYFFTLRNINTEKVEQKYNILLVSNIADNDMEQPNNTTKITEITDLEKDTSIDIISFLDESKRLFQCNVSMIDFYTKKSVQKIKDYNCYWCRHPFISYPIGCPIMYISSKAKKSYHSEVSKDDYIINENITKYKRNILSNTDLFITKNKANITLEKNEYYETDGIFCSFNCCKAFIKDNKHNNMYIDSDNLLIKLYTDINSNSENIKSVKINPAPHWRLLKEYGGHLSITEFREKFNKCTYDFYGTMKLSSLYKPTGMIYEEKINF